MEPKDMQGAFNLIGKAFKELKVWIEGSIQQDVFSAKKNMRFKRLISSIIKGKEKITRKELVAEVSISGSISKNYAYRIVAQNLEGKYSFLLEDEVRKVIKLR